MTTVGERLRAQVPSSSSYASTYDRRLPTVASSMPHSSQASLNAHTAAAQLSKQLAAHKEQTRLKRQQQEQLTQQRHQAALEALQQQQQAAQQADLQYTQRLAEKQKQEQQRRAQAAKQAREKKQLLPEHLREMGIHDITQATQTQRQTQPTQTQPRQQQQQQQQSSENNSSSSTDRYREELLRREDRLRKQLNDEREAAVGLRVDEDDEALRRIRQMRETLEQHGQEEQRQEQLSTAANAAAVQSAINTRTRAWMEGSYTNNVNAALALSSAPATFIPEETKSNSKTVADSDDRQHDLESSSLSSITDKGNDEEEEEDREAEQIIDQSTTHTAEINIRIQPRRHTRSTETEELVTPPVPSSLDSVFNSASASASALASLLPPEHSDLDMDQLDPAVSSSLAALTSSTEKSIRELTHMLNEMMQGFQISPEIDDEYVAEPTGLQVRVEAGRRTNGPRSTAYIQQIEADAQRQEQQDRGDEKKTAKNPPNTTYPPLSFSFADSHSMDRRSQSAKESTSVPATRLPNSSSSSSIGLPAVTTGPTSTEQERKNRVAAQEEEWSKMLSSLEQHRGSNNSNTLNQPRIGLFIPSVLNSSSATASGASRAVNTKDSKEAKKKESSGIDVSSLIDYDVSDSKEIEKQKQIERQIKQQQERQQTRNTQQHQQEQQERQQQPTEQPNAKQKEPERKKKAPAKTKLSHTSPVDIDQSRPSPPAGYASALRYYSSLGNPLHQTSFVTGKTKDNEDPREDTQKTNDASTAMASDSLSSSSVLPLLISTSASTAELHQWLEQLHLLLKHREKVELALLARGEIKQTQQTEKSKQKQKHTHAGNQEVNNEEQKEKATEHTKHILPSGATSKSNHPAPQQRDSYTEADVDVIPLAAPFVLVTKRNKPYQHKAAEAERKTEEPAVNYVVTAPASFDALAAFSSAAAAPDSLQACFARTHQSFLHREQQREKHTLEHKYDRESVDHHHQPASKQSLYSRYHQPQQPHKKKHPSKTKTNVPSSSVLRDLSNNSAFIAGYPYASSSFHPNKKKNAPYPSLESYVSYAERVSRVAERSFRAEAARKWHQLPEVKQKVHEEKLKEEKRRSQERRKSYDQQRRASNDSWYSVPSSTSNRHGGH